jgi:site-specific DNA-cytosine methylase
MRLLDLYCGPGGATLGYERAGWEVVGVDIERWDCYPGETIEADALAVLRGEVEEVDPRSFDAIHASPPCHAFSSISRPTSVSHGVDPDGAYTDLLTPTVELLDGIGVPYIVENVPGAGRATGFDLLLCGTQFGLPVRRHRLFRFGHWEGPMMAPYSCAHRRDRTIASPYSSSSRKAHGMTYGEVERAYLDGLGLEHVPNYAYEGRVQSGMLEAIPPAYTEWLGARMLEALA